MHEKIRARCLFAAALLLFVTSAAAARDTTPPTITITVPTNAPTWTAAASPLTVSGTASDNVGVKTVKWSNALTGGTGNASGTNSWSASIPLAAGQNIITVTARDAASNAGTDTITVTYNPADTSAPSVIITSPTSASTYCTPSSPLGLGGTAADDRGVTSMTWTNAASNTWGLVSGTSTWSASVPLTVGGNAITIQAFDAAGNKGTDTITAAYNPPDQNPPVIQIQSPTTDTAISTSSTSIDLAGTASDDTALASVSWSNAANGTSGTASGTTNWSATVPLVAGSNRITLVARDATGNAGSDTITVNFQDPRGIGHVAEGTLPALAWTQSSGLASGIVSGRIYNDLAANPAARMRDLAALGVRAIRLEIENTTPWSEYQSIVAAAQANGIEVLALMFLNSLPPGSPAPMDGDITYFDNFYVPAFIAAIDQMSANLPSVKFVEVWNEPDVYGFTPMYSQPNCVAQEGARRYALLAVRVFETMHQRRLSGITTPTFAAFDISRQDDTCLRSVLYNSDPVHNHRLFYRPVYGLPDGLPADIVSIHGYGNGGKAPFETGYTYQGGTFADGVNNFLAVKFADGRSVINQTPVWYTEVGYSVIQLGSETRQRDALTNVFSALRSHPQITAAFWYVYRDDEYLACNAGERFGLRDNRSTGYRPHLAYTAYQSASVAGADLVAPSGALLSPAHGASVPSGSQITVAGWAIDASGQAPAVDIAIDGVIVASVTDGANPQPEACYVASSARCPNVGFSVGVSAPAAPGVHEIAARARDAAGNMRVIGRIEVSVP